MSADLIAQLAEYGQYLRAEQEPIAVSEIILGDGVPPLDDVNWSPPDVAGRPRWGAAVLAAAAVAVLFVGGLAWLSRSDDRLPDIDQPPVTTDAPATTTPATTPSPTTTAVVTPPAVTTVVLASFDGVVVDAPTDLVTREVIPSSIGDLHWTVLTGDADADPYEIVRAPMGFAAVDEDGTLLVSVDAVEWRAVASPFPGRLLGLTQDADGRYVVELETDLGSTQWWESVDFASWELDYDDVALSDWVAGPGLVDTTLWRQASDRARTPDGAMFVKASFGLDLEQMAVRVGGEELQRQLDGGLVLGHGRWLPSVSDVRAGIVRTGVYEPGDEEDPGHDGWSAVEARAKSFVEFSMTISGSPDDWVIEIEGTDTRDVVGSVTGSIGEDDLGDTLTSMIGNPNRYFVISDGNFELVDPPWFDPTDHPDRGPVGFAMTDEALFAYIREGPDGYPAPTEVWRSIDGRSWQDVGTATAWPDAPSGMIAQRGGVLLAMFGDGDGGFSFLRSEDGINWQPIRQPPTSALGEEGFAVQRHLDAIEHGWLLTVEWGPPAETFEMWSSVEGDIWEPVDVGGLISDHVPPPVPLPTGGYLGGGTSSVSPDLVTWSKQSVGGLRTTWILEVTPSSS